MRRFSSLAPALSGVLLWLSFPPASLFPLAWVGLIPYLWFVTENRSRASLLVGHLTLSLFYFGGVLYWIPRVLVVFGGLNWGLAILIFGLMLVLMSLFLLPFTLLTRFVSSQGLRVALLSAPGFWLLTEILRNYLLVNGFPWASLGYSQFPYLWLIQIADVGGVYLISFLIVLANSAIYAFVRFRDLRFAASVLILLVVVNLYGAYRVHIWQPEGSYRVKAGLVQGNIKLAENREYYAKMYFEELARLAQKAAEKGAKWILLPEAQNPYIFEEDFYFKNFWSSQARELGVFILFNSASFDKAERGVYYNSAYQLDPEGEVSYRYDKVHLVPFGEYLPFAGWLTFARPLVEEVSSFHPGSELRTGTVGELRFGTVICYEAIFPEISRDYVNQQAGILVNLTNDAWFGPTAAPEQHLQMAAFRAIENRKVLLRAANSGYSAVVSVWGEIVQQTSLFSQDIIVVDVEANSMKPPYSFLGNGLNIAIIIVTSVALLLAFWRRENPIG